MSSPRYGWWGYAKAMIRAYPQLHREYEELHTQKITASISGMPVAGVYPEQQRVLHYGDCREQSKRNMMPWPGPLREQSGSPMEKTPLC